MERKNKCRCGKALCCKVIAVNMASVKGDEKWVEGREGVIIGNVAYLPSICKWLDKKTNKCLIHGPLKPEFCKGFPDAPDPWLVNLGCKYYD